MGLFTLNSCTGFGWCSRFFKIFKNRRGQVSIEMALVTGAILLIVISVIPYITTENTLNKGVSAARNGATFGKTMLNMGYTAGGASLSGGERVAIADIDYSVDKTSTPGTKIVNIVFTISGTSNTAAADEIVNQAANSVHYAFTGTYNTSTGGTIDITGFKFIVSYTFA
ncbi:MAG: class III signal peptide-containing protein [Candidatus Hydrothermarchaeaceae archaeon]